MALTTESGESKRSALFIVTRALLALERCPQATWKRAGYDAAALVRADVAHLLMPSERSRALAPQQGAFMTFPLTDATGVIFSNPRFGLPDEPPMCGVVVFPANQFRGIDEKRLKVSAWPRTEKDQSGYVLDFEGRMGSLFLTDSSERKSGKPELEGAVCLDWAHGIEGWLCQMQSGEHSYILLRLTTTFETDMGSWNPNLQPAFF